VLRLRLLLFGAALLFGQLFCLRQPPRTARAQNASELRAQPSAKAASAPRSASQPSRPGTPAPSGLRLHHARQPLLPPGAALPHAQHRASAAKRKGGLRPALRFPTLPPWRACAFRLRLHHARQPLLGPGAARPHARHRAGAGPQAQSALITAPSPAPSQPAAPWRRPARPCAGSSVLRDATLAGSLYTRVVKALAGGRGKEDA